MQAAISAHASSLEIAKMRLRTRENRPDGERVQDQAALALEEEEEHLMRSITKLHIQMKRVLGNFERLKASEKELERAIAEKEACIDTDDTILAQMSELAEEFAAVLEANQYSTFGLRR